MIALQYQESIVHTGLVAMLGKFTVCREQPLFTKNAYHLNVIKPVYREALQSRTLRVIDLPILSNWETLVFHFWLLHYRHCALTLTHSTVHELLLTFWKCLLLHFYHLRLIQVFKRSWAPFVVYTLLFKKIKQNKNKNTFKWKQAQMWKEFMHRHRMITVGLSAVNTVNEKTTKYM